jgi:hypothetical protein
VLKTPTNGCINLPVPRFSNGFYTVTVSDGINRPLSSSLKLIW